MDPRLAQTLRDAEARDYAERRAPKGPPFADIVNTTVPLFRDDDGATDQWDATLRGVLIPIDLQHQRMNFHSFRFPFFVVTGDTAAYAIALYEALPGAIGSMYSPSEGNMQLRLLGSTYFTASLDGTGDVGTTYLVTHVLGTPMTLEPTKQYYVWLDKDSSTRGEWLTPSQFVPGFQSQEGTQSAAMPPAYVSPVRAGATTRVPAPLVQLRSRYGSLIFGDASEE